MILIQIIINLLKSLNFIDSQNKENYKNFIVIKNLNLKRLEVF